jgi:predicted aldo/keto reductase-like oxidoreductase
MGRARYLGQGPGEGGLKAEQRADQCLNCGECLEACPQGIEIPDWMKKIHAELGAQQ